MPAVAYTIPLPHPTETLPPVTGCFHVAGDEVPLSSLRAAFPFEGSFQFRARLAVPEADGGYVWLDLVDDHETAPLTDGVAMIRAIPLFPVVASEEDMAASDFDLDPEAFDAWRRQRAQQLKAPLAPSAADAAGRGRGASSGWAEEASGGEAAPASSPTASAGWWGASLPAAGAASGSAAPSGRPRPESDADAGFGDVAGPGGAGAGGDGWADAEWRDDTAASGGRGAPQRAARASGVAVAAGGGLLKGLMSAAAKGISDAAKAAEHAAKQVEKKGWFQNLKKNVAAVMGEGEEGPGAGGAAAGRGAGQGSRGSFAAAEALPDEEDDGAGRGGQDGDEDGGEGEAGDHAAAAATTAARPAPSGRGTAQAKAPAASGGADPVGLDWRTD